MDQSLGRILREGRVGKGRSIRQQARLAEIDHATLLRWEKGSSRPTQEALQNLLRSLEFTTDQWEKALNQYYGVSEQNLLRRDQWSGGTIRAIRRTLGISQEDLASFLNIQQSTVSKWESGTSFPSNEQFKRVRELIASSDELDSLERVIALRNEISTFDLAKCFESYDAFWRACATDAVGYGEHWGVELTNRVQHLATESSDAKRLLSWIYSSRAYWLLVRGRHSEVSPLAFKAIRVGREIGFDFTSGYAFWAAARVHFTKTNVMVEDRQFLRKLARLTEREIGRTSLPYTKLVRSGQMLVDQNLVGATNMLAELSHQPFASHDSGQFGQLGSVYWLTTFDSYQRLYSLKSRDFFAVLDQKESPFGEAGIPNILNECYRLTALSRVSREDLRPQFQELSSSADQIGLGFAFSTMVSHVKRVSGINLASA